MRLEAWALGEWEVLGKADKLSVKPDDFETVMTPDGVAHRRYTILVSRNSEEWASTFMDILSRHQDCTCIKCFVNL